jgi:hypothetical protein
MTYKKLPGAVDVGISTDQDLVSGVVLASRAAQNTSEGQAFVYTIDYGVDIFKAAVKATRRASVQNTVTGARIEPLGAEPPTMIMVEKIDKGGKRWVAWDELSALEKTAATGIKINSKKYDVSSVCVEENVAASRVHKQTLRCFNGDYNFCCIFSGEPAYRIVTLPKADSVVRSWEEKHRYLFWYGASQSKENKVSASMTNRWYIGDELSNANVAIMRSERMSCACGNNPNGVQCLTKGHHKHKDQSMHVYHEEYGKFLSLKDSEKRSLKRDRMYRIQLDDTNETIELAGAHLKLSKSHPLCS